MNVPNPYKVKLYWLASAYVEHNSIAGTNTARAKLADLRRFCGIDAASSPKSFLGRKLRRPATLKDWTEQRVKVFLVELDEREHLSPATRYRIFCTLSHFARVVSEHYGIKHPMLNIRRPRVPRKTKTALSAEQVRRLLVAAGRSGIDPFRRERNYIAVCILAGLGIRCSEMLALTSGQVDITRRSISEISGKGSTYVDKILPGWLVRPIEAYLQHRGDYLASIFRKRGASLFKLSDEALAKFPLIVSVNDAQLSNPESFRYSYAGFRQFLSRLSEETGIKLTSHTFRHTYATLLYEATGDIKLIQEELNHASLQTTSIYLHPDEKKREQAVNSLYSSTRRFYTNSKPNGG